jgi:hypothetical protein
MLLWRSPRGDLRITSAGRPQSWKALLAEAAAIDAAEVPGRLRSRPDFIAALLTVYPHRFRADTIRLVEDAV